MPDSSSSSKYVSPLSSHETSFLTATSSLHGTGGTSSVQRRHIKKALRTISDNSKQRRRSSSWGEGSFGFGSVDVIPGIHLKNQNLSKTSNESKENVLKNPNEKWGWVVVLASCVIMIPIVGVLSSYGILVNAITSEFQASRFEAGWVGSLVFGFTVGLCPISNILIKTYESRLLAAVGIAGATASLVVTSFSPSLHFMFLSYSFCLGASANLIYNSVLTLSGQYFAFKNQALATCLASSGISFGTLIFNPICHKLMDTLNWRNTYRILAGTIFVVGVISVPLFQPLPAEKNDVINAKQPKKYQTKSLLVGKESINYTPNTIQPTAERKSDEPSKSSSDDSKLNLGLWKDFRSIFTKNSFDCSLCNHFVFHAWMLGTFLWSCAFLFPVIFLIDYMSTLGIPPNRGAYVLTSYGIFEFIGRLLCSLFADNLSFSMAYAYAASTLVGGLSTMITPTGKDLATMYAYSIAAGINSGIINSLMFAATMEFFGQEKGHHVWGFINVMLAIGMVGGPAVSGVIFDLTQSYDVAFYLGGIMFLLCSCVMLVIPPALHYWPIETPKDTAVSAKAISTKPNENSPMVRRRARKRKRSVESLRRKVLRRSLTKEDLNQNVEEAKSDEYISANT